MAFCCMTFISDVVAETQLSPKVKHNFPKPDIPGVPNSPNFYSLKAGQRLQNESNLKSQGNNSERSLRVEKERIVEIRTLVGGWPNNRTETAPNILVQQESTKQSGCCNGMPRKKKSDSPQPVYSNESPFSQPLDLERSPRMYRKQNSWINDFGSFIPKHPTMCSDGKERLFQVKLTNEMEFKMPTSEEKEYTKFDYHWEQQVWSIPIAELLLLDPKKMPPGVRREYQIRYACYQQNLERRNEKLQQEEKRLNDRYEKKMEKRNKAQQHKEKRQERKERFIKMTKMSFTTLKNAVVVSALMIAAIARSSLALMHRYVKEFDSERIVLPEEEPKISSDCNRTRESAVNPETKNKNLCNSIDTCFAYSQPQVNGSDVANSCNTSPREQIKKDEEESNSSSEANLGNGTVSYKRQHSDGHASNSKGSINGSYTSQQEHAKKENEKTASQHATPSYEARILMNLRDGEWLYAETMDHYMDILQARYNVEAQDQDVSFIRGTVIGKNPATGQWVFSPCLYRESCSTQNRKFGYVGNGEHFICYLFDPNIDQLRVYGADGIIAYANDMRAGVQVLKEGLEGVYCRPGRIKIEFVPSSIPQRDGYNCGVSCLLEFEKLLAGKIPDNVRTLQDYRRKIRNDILSPFGMHASDAQCSRQKIETSNTLGDHKHPDDNESTSYQLLESRNNVDSELPQRTNQQTSKAAKKRRKQYFEVREDVVNDNDLTDNSCSGINIPSSRKSRIDSIDKIICLHPTIEVLDNRGMVCKPCRLTGTKKGFFGYDMMLGTNFKDCKKIPKEFQNLYQKIREHLATPTHSSNVSIQKPDDMSPTQSAENEQAAIALARISYHILKEKLSHNSFPRKLALDSLNNVEMGNINHSKNFMADITIVFRDCIHDRLVDIAHERLKSTGRCSPFAVVADKCTPNKDTIHIIAIVILNDGQLKAIFLKADPLVGVTAIDLATSIINVLMRFFSEEEIRTRCVGFAFDGQYFQLGVDRKLNELLNITEENKKWYSFIHDPAHVIELAGKNARKQESKTLKIGVQWIRDVVATVTHGTYQCGWGKTWGNIREKAKEMKESIEDGEKVPRLKRFKRWCDTRFTAHVCEVLEAFRHNFASVYEEFRKTNDRFFKVIQQSLFAMQLCALLDIYSAIAVTSKAVQTVKTMPWHVDEHFNRLWKKLNDMKLEIINPTSDLTNWPNLKDCLRQIHEAGCYANCELENKIYNPQSTRSSLEETNFGIDELYRKLGLQSSQHIEDFVKNLTDRLDRGTQHMHGIMKECFSIESLEERGNNSPPIKFQELVDRSRNAGYLAGSVSDENMRGQYHMFADYVRRRLPIMGRPVFDRNLEEETAFYSGLICGIETDEQPMQQFPDILHLLAACITRTSCESVTESMGSVLKKILHGREALSLEHQDAEMCISWNGPEATEPDATNLFTDALDMHFGPIYHVNRTSEKRKLKHYEVSKSVDAETTKRGRLSYPKKPVRKFRQNRRL